MNTKCSVALLCAVFALAILTSVSVRAQQLIAVPPSQPVTAGERITITVLFHNIFDAAATLPENLEASIALQEKSLNLILTRIPGSASSSTQSPQIRQADYQVRLPESFVHDGPVTVTIKHFDGPVTHLLAYSPVREDQGIAFLNAVESEDDDLKNNDFLGSIQAYHPNYFLAGADLDDAKFQLSFKYQFINPNSVIAEEYDWLRGFYFAYTQLSLWDLQADSLPFEDTNFLPELFYQFSDVNLPILREASHADLQVGIQHESNGRDGDDSRSLNIAYIEPALYFELDNGYELSLVPRVWSYFGSRQGNEDISDFRGNASLTATYGRRQGFQIEAYLRGNPGTGNGAMQFDFTYPLTQVTNNTLGLYLHAQLFRGFGESLLDFNQRDTRFRIGLGLVR